METETTKKTKWNLDATHSEIGFKVKHMMITNVSGSFGKYDIKVETENKDFTTGSIVFTAAVDSITTGSADRDNHLKSGDFFDAAQYPELRFVSKSMTKKDEDTYELIGDLTIRDITRPVKFNVEHGGIGKDPWGNEKAGFTLTGKINRTDFNLNWNAALETGGVLVSEEVRLYADVQLVKEA
ncbi:MAG TPA: YceI family protein [Chryseosolibacter sp.]|nr:YceI family protein [Chryseosolibacter sp.]